MCVASSESRTEPKTLPLVARARIDYSTPLHVALRACLLADGEIGIGGTGKVFVPVTCTYNDVANATLAAFIKSRGSMIKMTVKQAGNVGHGNYSEDWRIVNIEFKGGNADPVQQVMMPLPPPLTLLADDSLGGVCSLFRKTASSGESVPAAL